ncbi:Hypothetical Protein PD5205_00317 [Xanthomonas fragariae]|uniref:3'-phosphate/5'-hydroxy nucleic acid ligase n=1 Tax=Xanthomonas fragariae TaxID=48664 RepID=A0A1Y6HHN7_9XANT|nr:hypothetical protein BER92_01545 [Xanthomonas fragariae]SMQ93592.1 Hypothetical Protein NBC2815_00228 [Xanthomonas fragariae]SMR00913.1 RNA-splicing ligase RtcB [Xanthomonas fragariae]SMR01637.1 Hypothetical Protein PD5205_00317 [Xanthomonas fragariae]
MRGADNAESFYSGSHGAGRVMSGTAARQQITLAQHRKATAHVKCCKDAAVIAESPAAYKSIDAVMAAQRDLVDVLHTLRQVLCVKGSTTATPALFPRGDNALATSSSMADAQFSLVVMTLTSKHTRFTLATPWLRHVSGLSPQDASIRQPEAA